MKKFFSLFLVAMFLLSACQPKEGEVVKLQGKIENPNSDSLSLQQGRTILKTFKLTKENIFKGEVEVKDGYYQLFDGRENTTVFLKPGYDINLKLNTKEFDETITYEGKGANENNYLAKKYLLDEKIDKIKSYQYYGMLDEAAFLKLVDSSFNVKMSLLKEQKDIDKDFYAFEATDLDLEKRSLLNSYEGIHAYLTKNKDFKVSENFPKPLEGLDLDNEKYLNSKYYKSLIRTYISQKAEKLREKTDEKNFRLIALDIVEKDFTNQKIKDEMAFEYVNNTMGIPKDADKVLKKFNSIEKNEEYKKQITEKYNKLKKIVAGMPSPTFTFSDINGKEVSLEELKGKLVYIDVWATWCGPCRGELPHLKKLEEDYHGKNIYFVSICYNDQKASWEKMVKEENLKGIQLYASRDENKFFDDYVINGIPHFILLDKEGKIIDSSAKRPSDPRIRKQFNELLK